MKDLWSSKTVTMAAAAVALVASVMVVGVQSKELIEPDRLVLGSATTHLNVTKCWWDIGDQISVQTRCYCYRYGGKNKCTVPGPTLVYTAGQDNFIRLNNKLVGAKAFDSDGYMVVEDLMSHDPDVTNLHTHGLHVDPAVDDVVDIAIEPGDFHDYDFEVLDDHYPGLHWYHDHWHGAVTFHVHTGLFGAIDMMSPTLDPAYPLDMQSRILILHGLSLNNNTLDKTTGECNCTGYVDWFDGTGQNATKNPLQVKGFHLSTVCDQWCDMYCYQRNVSGTPPRQLFKDKNWLAEVAPRSHVNWDAGITLFMVNGQVQPEISMKVGEWIRLRIVNADAQGAFMLYFNHSGLCDYYLIAADGIFFDSSRDLSQNPYAHHVFIPMAGRVEMVARCHMEGMYDVKHTAAVWNTTLNSIIGCNPVYQTTALMFTFNVTVNDSATTSSFNPNMEFPPKTGYIEDTTQLTVGQYLTEPECRNYDTSIYNESVYWTMHPDVFSDTVTTNCTKVTIPTLYGNESFVGALYGINGEYFRHDMNLATLLPGSVYEMKVQFFPHPFHHHINPFQLQHDIAYGFLGKKGEWRDVLSAGCGSSAGHPRGVFVSRIRTLDYVGKVVMHCHFLPHEDRGLMGYYNISSYPCHSSSGHGLPKENANTCAQEKSPDFCLGPIIAKDAAMLKAWNVALVALMTGVAALM